MPIDVTQTTTAIEKGFITETSLQVNCPPTPKKHSEINIIFNICFQKRS